MNDSPELPAHRFCVAPMMEWTDRHCRYFLRLLSRRALLYTEMVTSAAIVHGDRARLLDFDAAEHPVALQLGGSDPRELAESARIGAQWGYDEINLNVGCPSDRVQSGRFGACLMAEPQLVAECVAAMRAAVRVPVTVKCRIGIDNRDSWEELREFVRLVSEAGSRTVIVHARKAWLSGLSPRENREIPPLDYARVQRLKADRPELTVVLNGGLREHQEIETAVATLDGVMLGRAAYHEPYLLAFWQRLLFGGPDPLPSRAEVLARMRGYIEAHLAAGGELRHIGRHLLGLYQGAPGARAFRRTLSEARPGATLAVLDAAIDCVERRAA